jgi:DNA topoisomerase-1
VLNQGEELKLHNLTPKQHFTEAPPRFTEATLVKTLEEKGIGRPSTYAQIISTIQDREYVILENRQFKPTELVFKVTDLLVKFFPDILDTSFTAGVENELDDIEEGERPWVKVLKDFYGPFEKELEVASEDAEKVELKPEVSEEICPNCGSNMIVKSGRFGKFLACPGYPECKSTMPLIKKTGTPCPTPGCTGQVVEKRSRKGKLFYGCERWPDCQFVTWDKPTDKKCTTCNYPMGEHRWKGKMWLKCTNKDCPTNLKTQEHEAEGEGEVREDTLPEPTAA